MVGATSSEGVPVIIIVDRMGHVLGSGSAIVGWRVLGQSHVAVEAIAAGQLLAFSIRLVTGEDVRTALLSNTTAP